MWPFNNNKIRDLQDKLDTLSTTYSESLDTITNLLSRIITLESEVSTLLDIRARKTSNEPWVEVIGGDVDPERGIQLSVDWNDAFIEMLRAAGYKGTTENSLVAEWLLRVGSSVKEDTSKEDV